MKFSVITALASLVLASAPVFSQSIDIAYPSAGATIPAESQITVEIDRPDFQSSGMEVALVIAIQTCPNSVCLPPDEIFGSVLYDGPFNPQRESNLPMKPPHQNFAITLPGSGLFQLNVYHVGLLGAGNNPFTEFKNITLNLQ